MIEDLRLTIHWKESKELLSKLNYNNALKIAEGKWFRPNRGRN